VKLWIEGIATTVTVVDEEVIPSAAAVAMIV
jgi:hypothetical protein